MAHYLTKGKWRWANHLRRLDETLVDVAVGRVRKLLVTMPPRHGKSELCSHWFPVWYLSRFPDDSIIMSGYGQEYASKYGRDVRNTLTEHPEIGVQVSKDSSAMHRWNIEKHKGGMYAVGLGGPITGRGGNILILDDPVKGDAEARSLTYRERIWEWWCRTFFTRREPNAGVVLVGTRWHHDDLIGRVLKEEGDEWEKLDFPALDADGRALWEERFPASELVATRKSIGDEAFECLYQQRPTLEGGNLLKREWWGYYTLLPTEIHSVVQSWDTAFKRGETNDYSVCETWASNSADYYVVETFRDRVEFPELKRLVVQQYEKATAVTGVTPHAILIEDAASGQSLIQELRRDTNLPIIPVKPDKDKIARTNAITPLLRAGKVRIPERAAWVADFVNECSQFPSGAHDDQVDAMTQALIYLKEQSAKLQDIVSLKW